MMAHFLDILTGRAAADPGRTAFVVLDENGNEADALTYADLDRRARQIARRLRSHRGEPVVVMCPPGVEFLTAFFGCLYAGAIAVPTYPPESIRPDRIATRRLVSVLQDSGATTALVAASQIPVLNALRARMPELQALDLVDIDGALAGPEVDEALSQPAEHTVALLQYTSGSTAAPKGVAVTHGNLVHNSRLIQEAFRQNAHSRSVIWLPPYHDMGLIGGILQPVFSGYPAVLMAPLVFLRRPFRWLEAMSKYRATVSGGPDFAYDLCVRRITAEERAGLDLTSWDVAFNGAEPVRPRTIERFAEAFAPCGFRRESFHPCYGLAEATLLVSASRGPRSAHFSARALERARVAERTGAAPSSSERELVSCGVSAGTPLEIVDPESRRRCAPDAVGEIWVSGESVARGYWRRTAADGTFGATLADGDGRLFLRTGDLGFLRDGQLFIAGRLKDVVIIRGRNHHPQDLEATAELSHPDLQPRGGAAFSVDVDGEERLVVVHELRRVAGAPTEAVVQCVRQALSAGHEVDVYAVALLPPGRLPRTSSGKIQRDTCRRRFIEGSLGAVAISTSDRVADTRTDASRAEPDTTYGAATEDASLARIREALRGEIARVLRLAPDAVVPTQRLGTYGLDSLAAVEVQHRIESTWGVSIGMDRVLHDATLDELALEVRSAVDTGSRTCELSARPPGAESPQLSYAQEQLWFLSALDGGSVAYNVAAAARLSGDLDASCLQRALDEMVRRHEVLRTTFSNGPGGPAAVVRPPFAVPLTQVDFRTEPAPSRETAARQALVEDARRPFDLENGPLIRATVFRIAETEHVLLVGLHHIVCDGWSSAVFARELSALYRAFSTGRPSPLPALPLQYADYALWQRTRGAAREWDDDLAYWRRQLAGPLPSLDLPGDHPRPPTRRHRGRQMRSTLPGPLVARLRTLASDEGATLFMMVLAGFEVLLHRLTGQTDLVVGTRTTGRTRAALEPLVGFFVNPLPLRTDLSGEPTFIDVLRRVRKVCLDAYAHQDVPFDLLVQTLRPPRDPGRVPFFDVMCVLQNFDLTALEIPGARVESVDVDLGTAKYDLDLTASEMPGGELALRLEFNTDLFVEETAARLLRHLECLLTAGATNPETVISELPLAAPEERAQWLACGRGPRSRWPDTPLTELFERQVQRAPDRTTLIHGDERVTYRALDERVDALAARLTAAGVGADVAVGVLLERSADTVVALLATLRAGGAYLPLDASHPVARIAQIIQDARPAVVVTHVSMGDRVPAEGPEVLYVGATGRTAVQSVNGTRAAAALRDLSHVMYTSGSTGRPKGVLVEQRQLLNRLWWMWTMYPFGPDDVCCQRSAAGFSVSLWELLGGLLQGTPTVIVADESAKDVHAFLNVLAHHEVTRVLTVPSLLRAVLDAEPRLAERLPRLTHWTVCGEPLAQDLAAAFRAALPGTVLLNDYGSTETHGVLLHEVGSREPIVRSSVPIGRPIANTDVFILDERLEPVPPGVTGRLHVASPGLARGYVRQAGLTAERFVPHPFSDDAGERLYDSGDLAAFLTDGTVEYRGRRDGQIKVRGVRVEPAEVEAALLRHPDVREAAVALDGVGTPGPRLIAYVVPNSETGPSSTTLRLFLGEWLPTAMIPAAFSMVPSLPRTSSGKLDRRALTSMSGVRVEPQGTFTPPASEAERRIAAIWCELLGLEKVGVQDHFFDMGGHSLLLVQLQSRIRSVFGVELPLLALFERPTVRSLAECLSNTTAAAVREQSVSDAARRGQARRRTLAARGRRRQGERAPESVDEHEA